MPEADAEWALRREGNALEKVVRERGGIHSTISKDHTTGDDARHATQLANFGQKLSRFSTQTRSISTAQGSREHQDSREQSPSGSRTGWRDLPRRVYYESDSRSDSNSYSDEYEEVTDPEDSASNPSRDREYYKREKASRMNRHRNAGAYIEDFAGIAPDALDRAEIIPKEGWRHRSPRGETVRR